MLDYKTLKLLLLFKRSYLLDILMQNDMIVFTKTGLELSCFFADFVFSKWRLKIMPRHRVYPFVSRFDFVHSAFGSFSVFPASA